MTQLDPLCSSVPTACDRGGRSPSYRREAQAYACHPENSGKGGVLKGWERRNVIRHKHNKGIVPLYAAGMKVNKYILIAKLIIEKLFCLSPV